MRLGRLGLLLLPVSFLSMLSLLVLLLFFIPQLAKMLHDRSGRVASDGCVNVGVINVLIQPRLGLLGRSVVHCNGGPTARIQRGVPVRWRLHSLGGGSNLSATAP